MLPEEVLSRIFNMVHLKKLLQFVAHLFFALRPLVCTIWALEFLLLFKLCLESL